MNKVLYLDDDCEILAGFKRILRNEPYSLVTVNSVKMARHEIQKQDFQVIISDYRMPDLSGIEFFKLIKPSSPKSVFVILSGYTDETIMKDALSNKLIDHYACKPWDINELKESISKYIDDYQSRCPKDEQ
ncbi:MAG: response regulator [Candidatus Margulisbacteria bacterium]|nr:response regulator [Candidatus Margulisiibacteriota bacterium]